jgi:hypothetical protein
MFWWIVAVVVIVSVAMAWWSSGRKPGVIPRKSNKRDTSVADAQTAGYQSQRHLPGPPVN